MNVHDHGFDNDGLARIDDQQADALKNVVVEADDLLFNITGASIARCCLVPQYILPARVNQHVSILRCRKEQLVPQFLRYLLCAPQYKDRLLLTGDAGATRQAITKTQLEDFVAEIPSSLSEQWRIVGILDEAFKDIAVAKASDEKNLQNCRALFNSYLEETFTSQKEEWVEKTLGDVCEFIGGSQPPKSVFSKSKMPTNIRLIQIRDYKSDNHIVYIPRSQARRFCSTTDVMIGRYGPPLFQILRGLEGAYNVALMKAAPDEQQITKDFLYYFLKHPSILQHVIYHSERAAGQIGLTKETLEPYPIFFPPSPGEQEKVVQRIVEIEAECLSLEAIYSRKLAALDELKKSLLHKAFAGEL